MGTVKTANQITVKLLLFAQLRDRFGQSELRMSLPRGASGRDLITRLIGQQPSLKPLLEVSRLAVNCEYTSFDEVLQEGDEVVMIPPVSGG